MTRLSKSTWTKEASHSLVASAIRLTKPFNSSGMLNSALRLVGRLMGRGEQLFEAVDGLREGLLGDEVGLLLVFARLMDVDFFDVDD